MKVDAMTAELPLSTKQVKKLKKFYEKDIQYRREHFQMKGGAPRPIASNESGQHPSHQGGQHMGGGFSGGPGIDFATLKKYNAKQEKKLRKILGNELYSQWRSRHPKEKLELPEVEFK